MQEGGTYVVVGFYAYTLVLLIQIILEFTVAYYGAAPSKRLACFLVCTGMSLMLSPVWTVMIGETSSIFLYIRNNI